MSNKSKNTFRGVTLLVALIGFGLSIAFELNPDRFSGLGMAILSGLCFIALALSFSND